MNKAVIMAGGFGTRLRPLTMNRPKPMVPLLNRPMMEHTINLLKKHNISDLVSVLYYQPDKIKNHFGNGDDFGVSIEYVSAVKDFGTAGAIKNAFNKIELNETFIIISGDVLTDFDLSSALAFHKERKSKATILLTRVDKPTAYGIVMTRDDGSITRFLEKPTWGQVFSDTVNTGIYILEPEVMDLIPDNQEFDFSKDLFPLMLNLQKPLFGYVAGGYWRDIGNLNEYQMGQEDALRGEINLIGSANKIAKSVKIDSNAKIGENVYIDENTIISSHCEIEDCVIGRDVKIGFGAKLRGVTIWDGVSVGQNVEARDDVICSNTIIGNNSTISENVFIGSDCSIGESVVLSPNIKLWPGKQVNSSSVVNRSLVQENAWLRELFTGARISGHSNIEINPEFGAKLGACFGMAFGRRSKILCSRDPNSVSRFMKRSITSGLLSVGVEISDLQETSIPQTRQELRSGKYDAGFHVRRSPRAHGKTDIIFFSRDGRDITFPVAKKIERYFYGEDVKRVEPKEVGRITFPERTREIYVNRFFGTLDIVKIVEYNYKILIDYSFGYASTIFPEILGRLGVAALSIHDYVDATKFHPDPTSGEAEDSETGKIMSSLGYNLGFTLESGSEKIAMIDERGRWIDSKRLLTIVTKIFLETHQHFGKYKIAVSIVATGVIEEIAKEYGVEVVRIQNSHGNMMEATRDEQIKFVGGVYGNFIFPEFLFANDGMYSVGKILEMLSSVGKTISEIDDQLPSRFGVEEEIACPWDRKGIVMRNLIESSRKMDRQLIEGVKIFENGDSVLIAPKREQAAFTIYSDATDEKNAIENMRKYKEILLAWI
jgi:mannose-1-phosphate guanylyltransferase / phosphomannomutase